MAARDMREQASGFTDPACVQEIYVEDIGDVQIVAGMLKITLTVTRKIDGQKESIAACRIVGPLSNAPKVLGQIVAAIIGHPLLTMDIPPDILPH